MAIPHRYHRPYPAPGGRLFTWPKPLSWLFVLKNTDLVMQSIHWTPPAGAPIHWKPALRPLRPPHRKPPLTRRTPQSSQLLTLTLAFRTPGTRMGVLMRGIYHLKSFSSPVRCQNTRFEHLTQRWGRDMMRQRRPPRHPSARAEAVDCLGSWWCCDLAYINLEYLGARRLHRATSPCCGLPQPPEIT